MAPEVKTLAAETKALTIPDLILLILSEIILSVHHEPIQIRITTTLLLQQEEM